MIISIYVLKTSQTNHKLKSIAFSDSKRGKSRDRWVCQEVQRDASSGQPVGSLRPSVPLKQPAPLSTDLVVSNGFGEPGTVQLQVNIRQLVQQLLWFKAVFLRVFNFQVTALGATELLKIKVQHCSQSGSKFLGNHRVRGQFMLLRQARRIKTPISVEEQEPAGLIFKESLSCTVSHKLKKDIYIQHFLYSPSLIQ